MALPGAPAIKALSDSASWAVSARPYVVAQLPTLANKTWDAATTSLNALHLLYVDTNPFVLGLGFSIAAGAVFFVLAEINKNYSQVDRMWSILPAFYILHFNIWARQSGIPHARLDLAVLWSAIWSVRLTYNFWRKGGYTIGHEDYRWPIIKEQIGPVAMSIFDLTFISFGQSVLLFMVASPAYILLLTSRIEPELTLPDIIFTSMILVSIVIETVADQQQWNYQNAKHAYLKSAKLPHNSQYTQEDLDRGFVVSGLWSWSRHPNLACEMFNWITLYQWAGFTSHSILNWTIFGTIAYVLIFIGSAPLTERISSGKYPQYKEYQQLVGKFLPSLLGGFRKSKAD
ncbi:DUF1295-domain-containing protein [Microthyrium microscopicum]|uniref:DUF1295-domain-containing protein n=1 Tax=Microthyrium microscopicum TaxID=703497 RepID=A0A6A6TXL6_9PEZI|nr:DUF1295-domain-containing protein [Microthyrium microscopicum]